MTAAASERRVDACMDAVARRIGLLGRPKQSTALLVECWDTWFDALSALEAENTPDRWREVRRAGCVLVQAHYEAIRRHGRAGW